MEFYIDLDNTVSDTRDRVHHLESELPSSERWSRFFDPKNVIQDKMCVGAEILGQLLKTGGVEVTFITGRPERLRSVSLRQLEGFYPSFDRAQHPIIMKPNGSFEPSRTWKVKQFKAMEEKNNLFVYIDDEEDNLKAVRSEFPNAICMHPIQGWNWVGEYVGRIHEPEVSDSEDVDNELYD